MTSVSSSKPAKRGIHDLLTVTAAICVFVASTINLLDVGTVLRAAGIAIGAVGAAIFVLLLARRLGGVARSRGRDG